MCSGFSLKLDRVAENHSEGAKNHSEGDQISFDVVKTMTNNHKECRLSFDVVF